MTIGYVTFIGSLVRDTEVVLERISLSALQAVVRAVRVAAVTGLQTQMWTNTSHYIGI